MKIKINSDIDSYKKGIAHGMSASQIIGCIAAVAVITAVVVICMVTHISYLIGIYIGCIPAGAIIITTFGQKEGYGNFDIILDKMERKILEFEADDAEELRMQEGEDENEDEIKDL